MAKRKPKKIDMYLSEEEILSIKLSEKEVELIHKDNETLKQKKENIELQYKNAILSLNLESQFNNRKLEEKTKSQRERLKGMADKRDIDGRWSYNPETREIVKED